MGEAKRRRAAGDPLWRWKDIRQQVPPDEAHGLAVLVTVTCSCMKGGRLALPAGRRDREWIIGGFEHSFEITHWLRMPDFPPLPGQLQ